MPTPGSNSSTGWQDRLEAARSIAEVVEACQDFVARFAPALLAQLPRELQPPLQLDAESISDYAVELVRRELAAGAGAAPMMKIFALFFTDAAEALARIGMARTRRDDWAYVRR